MVGEPTIPSQFLAVFLFWPIWIGYFVFCCIHRNGAAFTVASKRDCRTGGSRKCIKVAWMRSRYRRTFKLETKCGCQEPVWCLRSCGMSANGQNETQTKHPCSSWAQSISIILVPVFRMRGLFQRRKWQLNKRGKTEFFWCLITTNTKNDP